MKKVIPTPPVGYPYKKVAVSRSPIRYTNEGYQDPNFYKIYD